jgi:hypothetical protein
MDIPTPRTMSFVTFTDDWTKDSKPIFKNSWRFIFLGEIVQNPGCCVVACHDTGKIFSGYHTERFREMTRDEC